MDMHGNDYREWSVQRRRLGGEAAMRIRDGSGDDH
jgi:hypothetical protein